MTAVDKSSFSPYLVLNISFAVIIFFIFLYSGFYSAERDDHPIPSFYEKFSGEVSPTSGLSRSFSEIIRGNFKEAGVWNENGIPLFAFFLIQFIMRTGISALILRKGSSALLSNYTLQAKKLVTADAIISVLLFLLCFRRLLLLPFQALAGI